MIDKNDFYIVKLYISILYSTMSTTKKMKYTPTFTDRKPVKDIKEVMENDGIILYHQSQNLKPNPPLQGALSCTKILFSKSGGKPCSRKRRL